ncbi:MAG: aldo/keto reductase [Planctomycetaceae bacterium]|nr:aldo/keto reductase [Planctomycetaceae bacterium]
MEYRQLGRSGMSVPILTMGTATFNEGGKFSAWGSTGVEAASRIVDTCLDAGVSMFDSADAYSNGESETILGKAIAGKRNRLLISTKGAHRVGQGPNDVGTSRIHLMATVEASLKRLGVETIDLFQVHGFDAMTPVDETMRALDDLVRAGKIRYIGCSNYSGWHILKSLWTADKRGLTPFVAHQAHYSLLSREFEWELMPLALSEGLGTVVWSPLAQGRLTGKIGRDRPAPEVSRVAQRGGDMMFDEVMPKDRFYTLIDVLEAIAAEVGRSVSQVALNWVLHRPSVSTVIIGARNEDQLRDNLRVLEFRLNDDQVARLDAASTRTPAYPYWHQMQVYGERNPFPVKLV